ncbi:MAG: hypothetical protein ABI947_22005 [Chloroflexota bacterium]
MQTPVRTTMNFSPTFHIRLKRAAEQAGKPMAQLVEEKLTPILNEQEQARLRRMYHGLFALEGMSKAPITDASTTIDAVLYGQAQQSRGEGSE